ncbi:MAG: hypothetical protein JSV86_05925 [Gemmatimonadota bacterium]|nr:MAG: hypothetical protein JSV86_05925 [Gemmatimonadota bacterium]
MSDVTGQAATTKTWKTWTKRDDDYLEFWWGELPQPQLAERMGRTVLALQCRARQLGLRKGYFTLAEMARESGYCQKRIQIAARRASVPLSKNPRGHGFTYVIPRRAVEMIYRELARHDDGSPLHPRKKGEWGRGFGRCSDCGRRDRPRHARQRCAACYARWRYRQTRALTSSGPR